jgi:hypothetical protein
MLENFKKIDNPLTVIAIFAGISEISMATIAVLDPELRAMSLWFLGGFPTLLCILFFITLNFNHRVLYAPSDFKEDSSFIGLAIKTSASEASESLQIVETKIEELRLLIEASGAGTDKGDFKASISNTVNQIASEVTEAQKIVKAIDRTKGISFGELKVLTFLCFGVESPSMVSKIANGVKFTSAEAKRYINGLIEEGLAVADVKDGKVLVQPTPLGQERAGLEFEKLKSQGACPDDLGRHKYIRELEKIRSGRGLD